MGGEYCTCPNQPCPICGIITYDFFKKYEADKNKEKVQVHQYRIKQKLGDLNE